MTPGASVLMRDFIKQDYTLCFFAGDAGTTSFPVNSRVTFEMRLSTILTASEKGLQTRVRSCGHPKNNCIRHLLIVCSVENVYQAVEPKVPHIRAYWRIVAAISPSTFKGLQKLLETLAAFPRGARKQRITCIRILVENG